MDKRQTFLNRTIQYRIYIKKKNNKKNKRKALSFTIMMPIVQEKV